MKFANYNFSIEHEPILFNIKISFLVLNSNLTRLYKLSTACVLHQLINFRNCIYDIHCHAKTRSC